MGYWRDSGRGADRRARPQRPAWPTFKRAMGLLWPHRLPLAAYLGAIAFTSVIGIAPPLLIRRAIDHAIPEGDRGQLLVLVGLMIGMYLLGITSNIMSLGGIAIAIGVITDDGIVMTENAHRHLANLWERCRTVGRVPTAAEITHTIRLAAQRHSFELAMRAIGLRHHMRHQLPGPRHDGDGADQRARGQHCLAFAGLDAQAAQLQLAVHAADEFEQQVLDRTLGRFGQELQRGVEVLHLDAAQHLAHASQVFLLGILGQPLAAA